MGSKLFYFSSFNFACFLSSAALFFKKYIFLEYHQSVTNSFDPDQDRCGPNVLQKLSADDTGRERVNLCQSQEPMVTK